jgi:hypothetical protein
MLGTKSGRQKVEEVRSKEKEVVGYYKVASSLIRPWRYYKVYSNGDHSFWHSDESWHLNIVMNSQQHVRWKGYIDSSLEASKLEILLVLGVKAVKGEDEEEYKKELERSLKDV